MLEPRDDPLGDQVGFLLGFGGVSGEALKDVDLTPLGGTGGGRWRETTHPQPCSGTKRRLAGKWGGGMETCSTRRLKRWSNGKKAMFTLEQTRSPAVVN